MVFEDGASRVGNHPHLDGIRPEAGSHLKERPRCQSPISPPDPRARQHPFTAPASPRSARYAKRSPPTSPTTSRSARRFAAAVAGKTVVDLWGGLARRATRATVGTRHHRLRVVDHQGDDGGLRLDAGGARRARPRRAGRPLLARVRRRRQGRAAGALPALAQLGPRRVGTADRDERPLRLGALDGAARRPEAVVGAGHGERLSRTDASDISSARWCAGSPAARSGASSATRWRRRSAPTSTSASARSTSRGSARWSPRLRRPRR